MVPGGRFGHSTARRTGVAASGSLPSQKAAERRCDSVDVGRLLAAGLQVLPGRGAGCGLLLPHHHRSPGALTGSGAQLAVEAPVGGVEDRPQAGPAEPPGHLGGGQVARVADPEDGNAVPGGDRSQSLGPADGEGPLHAEGVAGSGVGGKPSTSARPS